MNRDTLHRIHRLAGINKNDTINESFNRFENVKYIFESFINEDFNTQKQKYLNQGIEENIVDNYLKDFKELKDKKFKEAKEAEIKGLNVPKGESRFNIDNYKTFKEVELIVDYVAGQRNFGSKNFEDIKVDGEPIFKNNDIEIYYADTPRACIQYKGNKPYSWCVASESNRNMFYNYRLNKHEPSFYFVKRIKSTDKEFSFWNLGKTVFSGKFNDKYHFFVVQVIKNVKIGDENQKSYIVTSAMNDGDIQMSWSEILKIAPELNGLQNKFEPKPLTSQEKEKIEKYKEGLTDEEFTKLPYKEKDYYMAVYVKSDKPLTDNQFKELPEDLKNKYVGFGVGLTNEQYNLIQNNSKLIKRYEEITKRKWEEFNKSNDKDLFIFKDTEINIILKYNLLNNLDSDGIKNLLQYSITPEKKDQVIDELLGSKELINKLDSDGIGILLEYSSTQKKIEEIIDKLKEVINNLNSRDIHNLLKYSSTPEKRDQIIDKLLGTEGFINKLDSSGIYELCTYSSTQNRDQIIDKLLGSKELINKLDSDGIYDLLEYSITPEKKDQIIDKLLGSKELINNLNSSGISNLLQYSITPEKKDQVIDKLLGTEGFINKLDSDGILLLLQYSSNKEKVKNTLIQNGIGKEIINNVIKDYRIETELIQEKIKIRNRIRSIIKEVLLIN